MKVLIVKLSSLGDVIHTLPALTDAKSILPNISFDWAIEPGFAEIPAWHPAIDNIISIPLRDFKFTDIKKAISNLRLSKYDLIIDAQGLLKSSLISLFAKGKRVGLSFKSAREPISSLLYNKTYFLNKNQHAITKIRKLFANALGYDMPDSVPNYGLNLKLEENAKFSTINKKPYIYFLHSTTWQTKLWPETYWQSLASLIINSGFNIYLHASSKEEIARANKIAQNKTEITVLPKQNLIQLATNLSNAKGIVSLDTGLGHLATALNMPTVALYGPTDTTKTGINGEFQTDLSSTIDCAPCSKKQCKFKFDLIQPCFKSIEPANVWYNLQQKINKKGASV
jgi:heptosyltransferase I